MTCYLQCRLTSPVGNPITLDPGGARTLQMYDADGQVIKWALPTSSVLADAEQPQQPARRRSRKRRDTRSAVGASSAEGCTRRYRVYECIHD